jgi:hypothetical protein
MEKRNKGIGCSLVLECFPTICKVLGSIPRRERERKGGGKNKEEEKENGNLNTEYARKMTY